MTCGFMHAGWGLGKTIALITQEANFTCIAWSKTTFIKENELNYTTFVQDGY